MTTKVQNCFTRTKKKSQRKPRQGFISYQLAPEAAKLLLWKWNLQQTQEWRWIRNCIYLSSGSTSCLRFLIIPHRFREHLKEDISKKAPHKSQNKIKVGEAGLCKNLTNFFFCPIAVSVFPDVCPQWNCSLHIYTLIPGTPKQIPLSLQELSLALIVTTLGYPQLFLTLFDLRAAFFHLPWPQHDGVRSMMDCAMLRFCQPPQRVKVTFFFLF